MPKLKLTKSELRIQKDVLKRYEHYLPSLQLKKQQLQFEIIKIHKNLDECETEIKSFNKTMDEWIDVFAENIAIKKLIKIEKINISTGNIAGVDIPVLEQLEFKELEYDFLTTPLWVDSGINALKKIISLKTRHNVLEKQMDAIREELRITTQRVNLFEKVKIPESKENIRKIQIYLGDMATAAVVIGKIAKEKIERKEEALVV